MGFSIGRFLAGVAPKILGTLGGAFGGPGAAELGTRVGEGFQAVESRGRIPTVRNPQTLPGRQLTPQGASLGFTSQQFGGGGLVPTSIGPSFASAIPRFLGRGGTALQLFGGGNGNGSPVSRILQKAREATGGAVTRNKIIDAVKACGIETTADTFGLDIREVCLVVVKGRTRRRRGVSAADVRRTKRTIHFASKIRKDLKVLAR